MKPKLISLEEKKLIGVSLEMNLIKNKTGELWSSFGPRIKEIKNRANTSKISLQIYPTSYFDKFQPTTMFTKWATTEVTDFNNIPAGLKSYVLEGGLYAVFNYRGLNTDNSIYQYIFSEWIPKSKYTIDNRPHFEVLGEKYKNNDPNSEEEIWIPIKQKRLYEM